MSTADTQMPPPRGDTRTPPLVHVVLFRCHPTDEWEEVFSHLDPEVAWRWSLECAVGGEYRYRARPAERPVSVRFGSGKNADADRPGSEMASA